MKIVVPVLALAGLVRAVSITGCHQHGTDVYCITESGEEVQVALDNPPADLPSEYTDCHSHGDKSYCVDPNGEDVEVLGEVTSSGTNSEDSNSQSNEESSGGENCHFHAGVEHCVGAGESESDSTSSESSEGQNCHFHAGVEHCVGAGESESGGSSSSCGIRSRDYDMPLRIGTLFVILVTSSIGVFLPMALAKLPSARINVWVSTIIKQFGTGVILSTAFVHLYTHADLMFSNECLGELEYEATTSAVVMAGIFLSFLTEYIGHRYILARSARSGDSSPQRVDNDSSKSAAEQAPAQQTHQHSALAGLGHHHGGDPTNPNTKLSVLVMEAGVIFHSILIGITLVVAGDSFYKTLLVVIVFHQFFEGLALGARIALLPGRTFPMKAIMGAAFALVTPVGMAIGMGVIHSFNGQDRHTLIALGTLDALSAGILVWVGLVDMWARDWVIEGGDMFAAPLRHVAAGGISLVAGMVLMGVLGKWA